MKGKIFVPVLFLSSTMPFAHDTLTYAVQCAYTPTGFSQIYYQEPAPYLSNEFEIGGRVQPASRVSVDLSFGAVHMTGYEAVASSKTVKRPSVYSGMLKAGVMYDLYKGDRSKIGALVQTGCNFEKTFAANPQDYEKTSCHALSPFGFIGCEPSVELTKQFVFFTRFGVKIRYNPPTQQYEWFANPDNSFEFRLVKKANSTIGTAIEGFCVGIRYQFSSRYFE
ncbi:MAG: hypothetical protein JXA71_11210 [Chitinispirillaceae bacterium]|nr:hypothetical protein [Chitinispirillaceae bacterium]